MKATTLLERQHRSLLQLCETVENGSAMVRQSLLPQLANDLAAHIAIAELVFYPAACEALHQEASMRSGRARHAQARRSLERALAAPVDSGEFGRAISELRSVVDLHAEEQENLLFPRVEAVLDEDALRRLALSMLSLYSAKVEAGYAHETGATLAI